MKRKARCRYCCSFVREALCIGTMNLMNASKLSQNSNVMLIATDVYIVPISPKMIVRVNVSDVA